MAAPPSRALHPGEHPAYPAMPHQPQVIDRVRAGQHPCDQRGHLQPHLSNSEVPVTIIYGDRDSVVLTELSARVADEAPTLIERIVIRGANHNRRGHVRAARGGRGRAARESSRVTAASTHLGQAPGFLVVMSAPPSGVAPDSRAASP
jgi:hypothetical protein